MTYPTGLCGSFFFIAILMTSATQGQISPDLVEVQRVRELELCRCQFFAKHFDVYPNGRNYTYVTRVALTADRHGQQGFVQESFYLKQGAKPPEDLALQNVPEFFESSGIQIANRRYFASLLKNKKGFSIDSMSRAFTGDDPNVMLTGGLHPFKLWVFVSYRTCFGYRLADFVTVPGVSNVVVEDQGPTVKISANIEFGRKDTPQEEALKGRWTSIVDKASGLFLEQDTVCDDYKASITIDAKDGIPTSMRQTIESKKGKVSSYLAELIDCDQDKKLDVSECFLPFYGLPEPPELQNKSSSISHYLLLGLGIALGSSFFVWAWNRFRR